MIVALIALATMERTARAELDLRWTAPPDCPQSDEVHSRVRALARSVLDQSADLSVEGRITRASGRFTLKLLVRDGRQVRKRVISSDSCAALSGAAAVTLALLLGVDVPATEAGTDAPDARNGATKTREASGDGGSGPRAQDNSAEASEPGEEPNQRTEKPAEPSPALPPQPPTAPAPRPWAVVLRVPAVLADVGLLPHPAFGGGLGVGVHYESWRIVLAGRLWAGQSVSVLDQGSAFGADLRRATGQLTLCRGRRLARFEIAPCVGLAVETISAKGFGDGVTANPQRAFWLAPSVGLVGYWYATDLLAFFLGVGGSVELASPQIVIEQRGEVTRLGAAAAGVTAGLEWSF